MEKRYKDKELLAENQYERLTRSICENDNTLVLLRQRSYPAEKSQAYFQEKEVLSSLNTPFIPTVIEANETSIVLQEPSGILLKNYIATQQKLGIADFLPQAVSICKTVKLLHEELLLIRNLSPESFYVNPETESAILINLHTAAKVITGHIISSNEEIAVPDYRYCSPEQLRKLSVSIDFRSDIYALGVILYELLAGHHPFAQEKGTELLYSQLTRTPLSPDAEQKLVSQIILKMLNKQPEERYQSIQGVISDLMKAELFYKQSDKIPVFILGSDDVTPKSYYATKLYGRQQELNLLNQLSEDVKNGGRAFALISGPSGVGKTFLINHFRTSLDSKYQFIMGKFDQYKQDIPFSGLRQAAVMLIDRVLALKKDDFESKTALINATLKHNAQVLCNIIPELEVILGSQENMADLELEEVKIRFKHALEHFFSIFITPETPLVLFLDDMQWADQSTLEVLELLLIKLRLSHLLLIGSCRVEDQNANINLSNFLDCCQNEKLIYEMPLSLLNENVIGEIIHDSFDMSKTSCQELAFLVYTKSSGNPFVVTQLIRSMYQKNILYWKSNRKHWSYNQDQVSSDEFSGDAVDVVTERINSTDAEIRDILGIAAAIGTSFCFNMLAVICSLAKERVLHAIGDCIDNDFIRPVAASNKKIIQTGQFEFVHDKIQQAAYQLLDEKQKSNIHGKIASYIIKQNDNKYIENEIFQLADHINASNTFKNSVDNAQKVVEINLLAGKRAKVTTAYPAALNYFMAAEELLKNITSEAKEILRIELTVQIAETYYACGKHDAFQAIIDKSLPTFSSAHDKVVLLALQVIQHTVSMQYQQAMDTAEAALKLLDFSFPERNIEGYIHDRIRDISQQLNGRSVLSLLDMPHGTDKFAELKLKVLATMIPLAYQTRIELVSAISAELVYTSIKYGNMIDSCLGYSMFALSLVLKRKYQEAYQYIILAYKLSEKFNSLSQRSVACNIFGAFILHWIKPLNESIKICSEGVETGMESGNYEYMTYNFFFKLFHPFCQGTPLNQIREQLNEALEKRKNYFKSGMMSGAIEVYSLFLETFCRDTIDLDELEINECNGLVKKLKDSNNSFALSLYYYLAGLLYYYAGNYKQAKHFWDKTKEWLPFGEGTIVISEFNFYYLLLLAQLEPNEKNKKEFNSCLKELDLWTQNCANNFQHRSIIIQAVADTQRKPSISLLTQFENVIKQLKNNHYLSHEAIACEKALELALKLKLPIVASAYYQAAYKCYKQWGFTAKWRQLETRFKYLIDEQKDWDAEQTALPSEVMSVLGAVESVSCEFVKEGSLDSYMTLLMSFGCATRAVCLVKKDEMLIVTSEYMKCGKIDTNLNCKLKDIDNLPKLFINDIVANSQVKLLDDALSDDNYKEDNYIKSFRKLSLLGIPLVVQSEFLGLIYLENTHKCSAFSITYLQLYKLLTAQLAVSLKNIALLNNLQQEIVQRSVTELNLEDTQVYLEKMYNTIPSALVTVNSDLEIIQFNSAAINFASKSVDTLLAKNIMDVFPLMQPFSMTFKQTFKDKQTHAIYRHSVTENGVSFVNIFLYPFTFNNKTEILVRIDDISEIEKKDGMLRQMQKMETVGNLAGGLAHDFNNVLCGMMGVVSIIQHYLSSDQYIKDKLPKHIDMLEKSVLRASDMVSQLLNLSRKKELSLAKMPISQSIRNVCNICKNTFDKRIDIVTEFKDENLQILGDCTQIEQVLLNLFINASHAMTSMRPKGDKTGGILKITLEQFYADQHFASSTPNAKEGNYACIRISDNGVGMDQDTISKIFDPFFTTKEKGKGTGLGLSMVYNIVYQHQGFLTVYSQPGNGSVFSLFFPLTSKKSGNITELKKLKPVKGQGTILIVDDEEIIRQTAQGMLEECGYKTFIAEDCHDALKIYQENAETIDAVLLDYSMPGMSGLELYSQLQQIHPPVKALVASGFQIQAVIDQFKQLGVKHIIRKPYSMYDLSQEIAKLLEQ